MHFVFAIAALAAAAWCTVIARRLALWPATAAFISLGYVLGPPLWSAHLGPMPLTIDRLLLAGLLLSLAWHWRLGRFMPPTPTGSDWLLVATLAYFTIRCALTPRPDFGGTTVGPWWRLATAFWIPALLYLVARTATPTERSWIKALWILSGLGVFLALTGYAEVFKQWWAVFPRYIANPELGTHFGRARGPALNSASMGMMLTGCFWAAWFLWPRVMRWQQLAIGAALVVIAGSVFFTYTRSTWIGLAAGLAVVPLVQFNPRLRIVAGLGVILLGGVGIVGFGHKLTDLGRKDSDASAQHSVYQRASFAYVSSRMFADAPIFGCGFGRFYDKKIPYLADRSQQVELESLRNLDHHNTLLSVLVETGLVGLGLFVGLLAAWGRSACSLVRSRGAEPWRRAHGLFTVAVILNYLASALFHDLTLAATEAWLLYFAAGISVALAAQARLAAPTSVAPLTDRRRAARGASDQRAQTLPTDPFALKSPSLR